jgi:hypothetical protein
MTRGVARAQRVAQGRLRAGDVQRAQQVDLLAAQVLGVERARRLHRYQREHLQHVILQHVTGRAGGVVVAGAAALHAELLGDGDLDVLDVVAVPDRLEDRVVEAKAEQVLDRLLAEVVVDAKQLVLAQRAVQRVVQGLGRGEVAAEGLLDDHAAKRRAALRLLEQARVGPRLCQRRAGVGHGARGLQRSRSCGDAWDYFPHDHARSRAYRWNEDGLAGFSDDRQHLCLAVALWNGRDPILKERLFGVTGPQGNHGEDVKECYLVPRQHADAQLHADALQVSAASNIRTTRWSPRTAARGYGEPEFELTTTAGDRSRRTATSTSSSSTPRRAPDDLLMPHHGRQPRARGGADPRAAHAVVPQHLVVAHGRGPAGALRGARRQQQGCAACTDARRTSASSLVLSTTADGCSSPRTRPTPCGCTICANQRPYVRRVQRQALAGHDCGASSFITTRPNAG